MIEPEIIYRDEHALVLCKPSGLLAHSAAHMKIPHGPTLTDWLKENYPQTKNVGDNPEYRPGIVHRLDKDTSGVMIVALDQEAFLFFKQCFKEREAKKTYLALVQGEVGQEVKTIDAPIGVKAGTVKRTTHGGKDQKEAITKYRGEKTFKKNGQAFSLVRVFPLTGRTHQIRVHMNSIHHPIVGDVMYGGKRNALLANRLMLHAASLEIPMVSGVKMKFEAPLPEAFVDFMGSV